MWIPNDSLQSHRFPLSAGPTFSGQQWELAEREKDSWRAAPLEFFLPAAGVESEYDYTLWHGRDSDESAQELVLE